MRRYVSILPSLILLSTSIASDDSASMQIQPEVVRAQTLIDTNPLLSGYGIDVRQTESGLRLQGSVSDENERRLALGLARLALENDAIENAMDLRADKPEAPGPLLERVRDLTTETRLRQRLAWQRDTAVLDVDVEVQRGVARLNGQVGSLSAKDDVTSIARNMLGVGEVFSYLTVDPSLISREREAEAKLGESSRSDRWIAKRLRALLSSDTTVRASSVDVSASDGVVTLRGSATSSTERKIIEHIAGKVPGVREVDSLLLIETPL